MRSIRARIILITVVAIILSMTISMVLGIIDVVEVGQDNSEQVLDLLCETGEKNLNYYFSSVEQSVKMVASYAETDLESVQTPDMSEHIKYVDALFGKIARQTNGVLTYYYRIDPEYSTDVTGFWYVDSNGNGYVAHEVTDITKYDTNDTTQLVWYTVPKASKNPVWLPPYITDNLDARVISYNVPIFCHNTFIGVIGIEIDYSTMANQVDNIKLYENGYAFINDKDGNLIYHPFIDVLSLPKEEIPTVPKEFLQNERFIRYEFDGTEKEAVRVKLANGMMLNVTVPISEIHGNWKGLIRRTILISIGLLLLFVLITLQFARHITHPLTELTKAAERVSEGDYDVELNYSRKDEVGILTHSFRLLIDHIKGYTSELNKLNSQLKEDNLTLEAATIRDSLTGVKNRFALRRDYEKYIETDLFLLMLDIDDFKRVNDTLGHSVGDYLLKKTGDALLDHFGAEHSYRYGGDEFLVIFPNSSKEEFEALLKGLKEQLEEIYLEEKKMSVYYSAGYVFGKTLLQDDLRLMLRQADELLYEAKKSGKNSFIGKEYDREYAEHIRKKEEESFRQG